MKQNTWDEQQKWDKEKWPARKESVYHELFHRAEQQGERDIRDITEKDIEQMREDIGIRRGGTNRASYAECNRDNLRHLARGNGDLNPLYYDEEYARKTRWGGLIAPPTFIHCTGTFAPSNAPPRQAGVTRGFEGSLTGDETYFYRPIRPGDFVWQTGYLYSIEKRSSQLAGQALERQSVTLFANQKGEVIAVNVGHGRTFGRQRQADQSGGHGERTKYVRIQKAQYTPDDIKRINTDMDREEVRGAKPRYWEDVSEGDELVPVVKGPLTIGDTVAFDVGHGMAMYDGAHHIAYNYRKRHPAAFRLNEYGIPDVAEARHWMERLGRQLNNVGAFNYGQQTYAWLCHVVTNWMGDDAWLYRLDVQYRRYIFNADTNWVHGKVIRKYVDDAGQYKVDLEIWSEDQRGDEANPGRGRATVMLPSRAGGLPTVPPLDTPAPFTLDDVQVPIAEKPIWQSQLSY